MKRADLNGDGREDYVLYTGWVVCEGAFSVYGDREKGILVFAGDAAGNAREAFNDSVYDAKIEGAGPTAKLWLTTSGQGCGKKPAAHFASEAFCWRPVAWDAGQKKFTYAPLAAVKMIE